MQRLLKNSVFIAFGIVAFLFLGYLFFLSAPADFKPGVIVSIEEGSSLHGLSRTFKDDDVIRSRAAFEAFVITYGGDRHIMPGDYLFENKVPVYEVARRIARGEHHLPPLKVTIPEGFTNADAALAFGAKLPSFSQANFLTLAKTKQGYLFPDTYFFSSTDTEDDVIKLMSDNYEKKVAPLRSKMAALGKSEKEIITMASLIEGEAKGDADRPIISGILWKRLGDNMRLQVDAAAVTYTAGGLPSAPVSNPGLQAIQAAMYPQSSPYLFYLHDSAGNIHYAKTFAEHKANKAKYLK